MITDLLESITKIGILIYTQVKIVKANQSQCQLINGRVGIVLQAIDGLEKVKEADRYRPGLIALEACLKEALEFITQFSRDKSWFKKVLKAGPAKEQFQKINEKMQSAVQQLNLGLAAKQITDRELDKKAQQEDVEWIRKQQEEILKLNQEAYKAVQKLNLQQQEQNVILLRQFASMKRELQNHGKAKPEIEPHLLIAYYEFAFDEEIGKGSYGTVYLGSCYEQAVAIKTIESKLGKEEYAQFVREIQIMSRLHSPNIVQLYGACIELENLCLSMEFMDKGSLDKVLNQGSLSIQQQKDYAVSIAKGLLYLHNRNFVHCDLKSANILVNSKGEAKITDFGLSKASSQSIRATTEKSQAIEWQAPECLKVNPKFTIESDVYAFGVILWELATGKRPFANYPQKYREKMISDTILSGKREVIPSTIPPLFQELIRACWEQDPHKRPALKTIIAKLEAFVPEQKVDKDKVYEEAQKFEENKKFVEAFVAYRKAAELGHIKAKTSLGFCYMQGQGTERHLTNAFKCFTESANAYPPHSRAMKNLAAMHKFGQGVPIDLSKAAEWLAKAKGLEDKKEMEKRVQVKL